jgi:hypothetical protein
MSEPNEEIRDWTYQKEELLNLYPVLTDVDFEYLDGEKDVMLANIREIIGKTKEEFDEIIAYL